VAACHQWSWRYSSSWLAIASRMQAARSVLLSTTISSYDASPAGRAALPSCCTSSPPHPTPTPQMNAEACPALPECLPACLPACCPADAAGLQLHACGGSGPQAAQAQCRQGLMSGSWISRFAWHARLWVVHAWPSMHAIAQWAYAASWCWPSLSGCHVPLSPAPCIL
jgi:hypothetical protein